MKNNTTLLLFLAVLVIVKFGILPMMDSQDESLDEIKQFVRSNAKLEGVLGQQDSVREQLQASTNLNNEIKNRIFTFKNESSAKVEIQRKLEEFAKDANVEIETINWQKSKKNESLAELFENELRVSIKGELINIIRFHSLLNQVHPSLLVKSMVNRKLRNKKSLFFSSKFKIDTLYLLES